MSVSPPALSPSPDLILGGVGVWSGTGGVGGATGVFSDADAYLLGSLYLHCKTDGV